MSCPKVMPFHDVSLPMQGLLTAWVSALLYGCNVVLSAELVRLLLRKGFKHFRSQVIICLALTQFAIATAHVATCLQMAIDGLVRSSNPDAYYGDQAVPVHVAQIALFYVNSLIADALLIWRLNVLWQNRALCVPFIILFLGAAVAGIGNVVKLSMTHSQAALLALPLQRWSYISWSLSAAIQVGASSLLAYKIWTAYAAVAHILNSPTRRQLVWIILESGVVLSSSTLLLLGLYACKRELGAVVIAALGQIDTAVPSSILVRASLNKKAQEETSLDTRRITGMHFTTVTSVTNDIYDASYDH